MNPTSWLEWSMEQTADLSKRLVIQGYDPLSIERLRRTNAGFDARFTRFEQLLDDIAESMVADPDGYHHYDRLTKAKIDLLTYTCTERGQLLQGTLAHTA